MEVSGELSESLVINISVLQGSILGPILFLVMINDLPDVSSVLKSFLFADDTSGLAIGKDLPKLMNIIITELKNGAFWFRVNKQKVNTSKTKSIFLSQRQKTKSDYL